jgi:hypothetical protein
MIAVLEGILPILGSHTDPVHSDEMMSGLVSEIADSLSARQGEVPLSRLPIHCRSNAIPQTMPIVALPIWIPLIG